MELTSKITPFQFYSILFLSRVFSMVTYVANVRTTLQTTDEVIAAVFTGIFLIITAIPTAVFLRQNNKSSIIMRSEVLSKRFAKSICVIYLINYLYFGIITSVRFGIFTGSVMFPDTNISFFIFAMLLTSAYIAFKGIESLGRTSVVILVPVIFALIFVFATQADEFDILNFTFPFESGIGNIFSSSVYSAARTGELAFVLLLTPYVKNQKGQNLYFWIFAVTSVITVTELLLSGVLGLFGGTQLFSMYSLSVLAEFGFIERMDAIISCLWLLCAAVKTAVTVFLCKELMTSLFGKNNDGLYIFISCVILFVCAVPLGNNIISLATLIRSPLAFIFYFLSSVAIPVCVMISEKIKGRKNYAKA